MKLNPYLFFDGQCQAAFKFYERCLAGKMVMMMTYGEAPGADQMPPEARDKIIHARLLVGDQALMGADTPPDRFDKPQGFSVSVNVADPAEAERVFKALSENGAIRMPMEETFWALRFGMLVDQFGIPWMVNCEKPL